VGGAVVFETLGISTVYVIAGYMLLLTVVSQVVREGRRRAGLPL
jgi:hypothetical protein